MQHSFLGVAIAAFITLAVVVWRVRHMSSLRPLRIGQLWIIPTLYGAVVAITFIEVPPHGATAWAICGVMLLVGGALGWQRGRMMRIEVDPATHTLNQRASPAALLFIAGLVIIRWGARVAAARGGWDVDPLLLTDGLMAMALGLITVQRIEMYLRARRMLAALPV